MTAPTVTGAPVAEVRAALDRLAEFPSADTDVAGATTAAMVAGCRAIAADLRDLVRAEQERVKGRPRWLKAVDEARVHLERAGVHVDLCRGRLLAEIALAGAVAMLLTGEVEA